MWSKVKEESELNDQTGVSSEDLTFYRLFGRYNWQAECQFVLIS